MIRATARLTPAAVLVLLVLAAGLQAQQSEDRSRADQSFQLGLRLEQAGNIEQALAIYRDLNENYPAQNRYYYQLVRLLRQQGRHSEWLAVLNLHLEHFPEDIAGRIDVGEIYLQMNRREEAVAAWGEVLTDFPGHQVAERLVLTRLFNRGFIKDGQSLLDDLRAAKGDSAFYAMEIARMHTVRLSYNLATDEYIRHLRSAPRSERTIRNHLLGYPTDEKTLIMLRRKLGGDGSAPALRILAALEFKYGQYGRVIELYRRIGGLPDEYLDLAQDLMDEQEYDLAEGLLLDLIREQGEERYQERAILSLAEIYLSRSQAGQTALQLAGLFPGNAFFTRPFLRVADAQLASLRQAIALYDSLAVTRHNPRALLRLAEIKFRILDDFDGAISDLETILNDRLARALYPEVILLLIDTWIAKGDLAVADDVRRLAPRLLQDQAQLDRVELKTAELIFLAGDADSLLAHIGGLMASLGTGDPGFNDLLELDGLVRRLAPHRPTYASFIASERLLRRNRRSEAIALLQAEVDLGPSDTRGLIQFRLAQLHAMQGDYALADDLALGLGANVEYAEAGLLLAAEVADYLAGDPLQASQHYLAFLDAYGSSVHHDVVRLRFRKLNPDAD